MVRLLSAIAVLFATTSAVFAGPLVARDHSGSGTWYDITVGDTACGELLPATAPSVAVSFNVFNTYPGATTNPNLNPICGKVIDLTGPSGSMKVHVHDKCQACAEYDIDMTTSVFKNVVGALSIGRAPITWKWAVPPS